MTVEALSSFTVVSNANRLRWSKTQREKRYEHDVSQLGRSGSDRSHHLVVLGSTFMREVFYFQPSWPTRLGLALIFLVALAAGTVLAVVFFALFAAGALVLGGWLWWQTRRLQRQAAAEFIHAEYTVEKEYELLEDQRRRDSR